MSGTTGKGIHYPTAGDTVGGVAATVQTLAQDVDKALGLRASAVLDFPNIAAGAAATLTIAVPGATVGQHVVMTFNPVGLTTGVVLMAGVSAADTVTVKCQNVTAAAVNPAAITVLVCVLPFSGTT